MKLHSLIFDLDGTLVDSREDIIDAVNFTLKKTGVPPKSPEEIISYVGTGAKDLVKRSLGKDNQELFKDAFAVFKEYYRKHSAEKSRLYPHVRAVLEHFRTKQLFIVTNRTKEMALATLGALGIDKYFNGVIGADKVSCVKPSACPLDSALALSGTTDKKQSMMVGDMDLDILSGKAAGVRTCGVTYGIGKKESIRKAAPDYIIDDIIELIDIAK